MEHSCRSCTIFCYVIFSILSTCTGEIVRSHQPFTVTSGQMTILPKSVLRIRLPNRGGYCSIKVLYNENSLDSGVGRLIPPTFPCNYTEGDVYYEHFGLPILMESSVELVVTYTTEDLERLSLPISLQIIVTTPTNNIVFRNHGLTVQDFNGYSQPVSISNLAARYDRDTEQCYISLRNGASSHFWPR